MYMKDDKREGGLLMMGMVEKRMDELGIGE